MRYRIAEIIKNEGAPSLVSEISFHPSGSYFAVTYETINEVRIFDSHTRKLLQVLKNPDSQLDGPHGVLFTHKYLLITNKCNLKKPGIINVYRNGGATIEPIQSFQTPFNHLREPHSLALHDGRLVITYCENLAPSGAIVSCEFNEETGKISGPLDKTESWFQEYGDAKGIYFNSGGTKIFVTFASPKQFPIVERIYRSLSTDKDLPVSVQIVNFSRKVINRLRETILSIGQYSNNKSRIVLRESSYDLEGPNNRGTRPKKNGIAVFSINIDGKIARVPERIVELDTFRRLENIDIFEDTCVITDLANRTLFLYDWTEDPEFKRPIQTVDLGNATPHGAKFSPDGRLLVTSSLGVKVADQVPQWSGWESPREDKIVVFERAT